MRFDQNAIIENDQYGFKTYAELPSESELASYYKEKYFRTNKNYDSKQNLYEIESKISEANFLLDVLQAKVPDSLLSIVEIGAGEGFFVKAALDRSFNIIGVDFDKNQIHESNIACQNFFIASDDPAGEALSSNLNPACLVLRHVIEHVRDPLSFLDRISLNLKKETVIVIEAPHDFKNLQKFLTKNKLVNNHYWLSYPDHLSYFEPNHIESILKDRGFEVIETYSDFPIEIALLSDYLNYNKDETNGPKMHNLRCCFNSYVYKENSKQVLDIFKAFKNAGLGRSFTVIAKKSD